MMTEQDALPAEGMPEPTTPHKVSFTGLKTESLADVFAMDTEHTFEVRGKVLHRGPKRDAKGNLFIVVQINVDTITPKSFEEPSPVSLLDGAEQTEQAGGSSDGGDQ